MTPGERQDAVAVLVTAMTDAGVSQADAEKAAAALVDEAEKQH
jgi:hypothetical protein